jgi:molybdopterin-synthase adenylyltransferase
MNRPQLRPSVSVVLHPDRVVEFFLSNTRRHELIQVSAPDAADLILSLDGTRTVGEIETGLSPGEQADLRRLLDHLEARGILHDADAAAPAGDRYRRILSFLGDFALGPGDLKTFWELLRSARVLIFGVGAVGSWVAYQLAQTGVGHLVLCDPDVVEPSNLNRQLFFNCDVGAPKVDALARTLRLLDQELVVETHQIRLNEELNLREVLAGCTMAINCADYPTVDQTSEWLGHACMPERIPHLIAGGYNLHLSLVGPTILPYESACVKCLETGLASLTPPLPAGMRRLARPNRKLGSIAPLCAISASFTVMEAIKVITGCAPPANVNRRGEFDIHSRTLRYTDLPRRPDCEWCGRR